VRNAKIPPLRPQNPQVEPELEDVVRKALARRAEDRYTSALDLQDALAHYSYSRGLKVISRDIADLVRQCLEDNKPQGAEVKKPPSSIIDTLLQNEIVKFTSVDFEDPGARPLSADDLSPSPAGHSSGMGGGGDGDDFIDPRAWANERMTPVVGVDQIEGLEQRDTINDAGSIVMQAAQARDTIANQTSAEAVDAALGGPTPGPESLASILEPGTVAARPAPTHDMAKARRSFLIGAAIGLLLLGATLAVMVAKRGGAHPAGAPAATSGQTH
jgi:hypothetical protein